MREIEKTFSRLRATDEGGLITYITAGYPEPEQTPVIADALIRGGADIIELGIPFSDPIADGPTIQKASTTALRAGTTPRKVLKIAEEIKQRHRTPIVLLTYYNPIYRMGVRKFFQEAQASGVSGTIVPDLPVEEAEEYKNAAEEHDIDTIFLAAPSTPAERLKKILEKASGFLYLVSVYGVTGARETLQKHTLELLKKTLRITMGKIPLALGFGISKPEHVKTVIKNGADAAIVGSRIIEIVENQNNQTTAVKTLETYTKQLKKATKPTNNK